MHKILTMGSMDSPIPVWVFRWLEISSLVCAVDGFFCVLRPHSYPDGCLGMLFYPYKWYLMADKNYANPKDVFIWCQGVGNLIEVSFNLLVLFNFFKNVQQTKVATIVASAMTLWKTVLFTLYSLEIPIGHVVESWWAELLVLGGMVPWIVFPILIILEMGHDLTNSSTIEKSQNVKTPYLTATQSDALNNTKQTTAKDEEQVEDLEGENFHTEKTTQNKRQYNLRRR